MQVREPLSQGRDGFWFPSYERARKKSGLGLRRDVIDISEKENRLWGDSH